MSKAGTITVAVLLALACAAPSQAVTITVTQTYVNGIPITDFPPGSVNMYYDPTDGSGVTPIEISFTLTGPALILSDIEVMMNELRHDYLDDLHMELVSPSGTHQVLLRSGIEGGLLNSELEPPVDFVSVVFDDQAQRSLKRFPEQAGDDPDDYREIANNDPITGTFNIALIGAPDDYGDFPGANPLSAFVGEDSAGTWTLLVSDRYEEIEGTMYSWGIRFTGEPTGPPVIPEPCTMSLLALGGLALLSRRRRS